MGVSQSFSPVEDAFPAPQELRSWSGGAVGGGGRGFRYPARILRPGSRTVWVAICLPLAPSTSIPALMSEGRELGPEVVSCSLLLQPTWELSQLLPSLHSGITLFARQSEGRVCPVEGALRVQDRGLESEQGPHLQLPNPNWERGASFHSAAGTFQPSSAFFGSHRSHSGAQRGPLAAGRPGWANPEA